MKPLSTFATRFAPIAITIALTGVGGVLYFLAIDFATRALPA